MKYIKFFSSLTIAAMLCVSCSDKDDDKNSDIISIGKDEYVATGKATQIKPLTAVIEGLINPTYAAGYTSIGAQVSTSSSFYGDDVIDCYADGVSGKNFLVHITYSDGDGALEPSTTYYYRTFAALAGTRHYGKVKTFTTLSQTPVTSGTVSFGNIEWSATNLHASSPEQIGDVKGLADNNGILSGDPSRYDYVTMAMGSQWRTPNEYDWQKLLNESKCTPSTYKGVQGLMFSDTKTGEECIFLPFVNYNVSKGICTASNKFDFYALLSSDYIYITETLNYYLDEMQKALDAGNYDKVYYWRDKSTAYCESARFPIFCIYGDLEPGIQNIKSPMPGSEITLNDGTKIKFNLVGGYMFRPVKN